tara:strand:+ start:209 stop:886 length:678 start_codon:yes stop_codon:yes gene_type:complete
MIKTWVFILFVCVPGFFVLIFLGTWQVQRLAWKESLLNEISTRLNAQPSNLPLNPRYNAHNYLMTTIEGKIQTKSVHVLISSRNMGPGFRVISPLLLKDGRTILIDRGIIPEKDKNSVVGLGSINITGYLLWPNETDSFTPDPNFERNIWFSRDLDKMADFLETEKILLVATKLQQHSNFQIQDPTINIPNNHLQYAITWFLMSGLWLGMSVYFFYRNNLRKRVH